MADDLDFGISVLHPMDRTWILTHLSVQMNYMPMPGEHVVFETWIEQNAHMLSTRDYRIYLKKSEVRSQKSEDSDLLLIGQCKSVWAVLDMKKREIANCFDLPLFQDTVDGEVLEMNRVRMTTIPEPTGIVTHKVVYSDIDYNEHCNSCRYLAAMSDAYLPDYYGKKVRLDINYSKEVMLGEELQTLYLVCEDGVQYQQKNSAGETSCSAKITVQEV